MKAWQLKCLSMRFRSLAILLVIMSLSCKEATFPLPPKQDSSTPQKLLKYYGRNWKSQNYHRMYGALHPRVRESLDFAEYTSSLKDQGAVYGKLLKLKITDQLVETGHRSLWEVELEFQNTRVPKQTRKVWCEELGDRWFIAEGGFVAPTVHRPQFDWN